MLVEVLCSCCCHSEDCRVHLILSLHSNTLTWFYSGQELPCAYLLADLALHFAGRLS
jgi:hypothetical protein